MEYSFKIYTSELLADWKAVISNSDEAWLFHEPELVDFFCRINGSQNSSLLVYNSDNKPVAVCPLSKSIVRHKFNRTSVKIESINMSGPALIKTFGEKKRRELLHAFADEFNALIKSNDCSYFSVASANLAPANIQAFVNPLLDIWGFSDSPLPYYYMDLRQSKEDLLSKMETRTRTILKKTDLENQFEIKSATEPQLGDILEMAKQTKERFRESFNPSIRQLYEYLIKSDYFKTLVAYINQKPACCIILCQYKNTGYYYHSFTATEFISTEIGTFLLWQGILQQKAEGVEHFDLGSNLFDPNNTKDVLISKFKRGFGGSLRYKFWLKKYQPGKLTELVRILKK